MDKRLGRVWQRIGWRLGLLGIAAFALGSLFGHGWQVLAIVLATIQIGRAHV